MEPCTDGEEDNWLARDAARALAGRGCGAGLRRGFETARGDLEAGDAFVAGDGRHSPGADGTQEGDQLGTQRFVMSDRQMAHRIAAVRLEAETFGDLAREQIAHDIFA